MRLAHRRQGLVLFFMLAFALVGFRAPAAHAAPGNGAYVMNVEECYTHERGEYEEGYTECITAKGVVNEITTPSGNTSFFTKEHFSVSITDPEGNVVFTQSARTQYHSLTMEDVLHELSIRNRATFTFNGEPCTASYVFHQTNGEIQLDHFESSCTVE